MASRLLDFLRVIGKGRVLTAAHFQPQGVTQLVAANYGGRGIQSVTRTGVGAFTVTLQDGWPFISYASASLCSATLQPISVQIGTVNLTAKTITLFCYNTTTGAASDVVADPNTFIRLALIFRNTTIPNA